MKINGKKWKNDFENLQFANTPRWYGFHFDESKLVELHIFADASSQAYAAVSYFRSFDYDNNIKCSFIMAKSRLAPLNENILSIPKLELQAAVIAVRIKNSIISEISFKPHHIYFWTDSKTVLKYIKNQNSHFPKYVMYRVNEIRQKSDPNDWYYLPSKDNIADICTRPINNMQNLNLTEWLESPPYLEDKDKVENNVHSEVNYTSV